MWLKYTKNDTYYPYTEHLAKLNGMVVLDVNPFEAVEEYNEQLKEESVMLVEEVAEDVSNENTIDSSEDSNQEESESEEVVEEPKLVTIMKEVLKPKLVTKRKVVAAKKPLKIKAK